MFLKIYQVFPRLPFGIVAYAFTLFWTTFVNTAVNSITITINIFAPFSRVWHGCTRIFRKCLFLFLLENPLACPRYRQVPPYSADQIFMPLVNCPNLAVHQAAYFYIGCAEDLWHGFPNHSAYWHTIVVFGIKRHQTEIKFKGPT